MFSSQCAVSVLCASVFNLHFQEIAAIFLWYMKDCLDEGVESPYLIKAKKMPRVKNIYFSLHEHPSFRDTKIKKYLK